jgi:uncharacterized protein YecT (DUF1311 family)
MMPFGFWVAAGVVVMLTAGAAGAQEQEEKLDCESPTQTRTMMLCEQARADKADKALNAQYKKTRAVMGSRDSDLKAAMKGAEQALVTAQRAWIAYRDAECEAEGFQARGGTMEPMLVAGCIANVTDTRTKQLKMLEDAMSN